MVQQKQINDYFNANHKKIKELATFFLSKRKIKFIEVDALISHAYLNIMQKLDSIEVKDIEPYTINFIKCHCIWTNKITTEERIKESAQLDGLEIIEDEPNEKEIKLTSIEEVYKDETDQVKKIIYEVFFTKKINTVRSMAAHFNISQPSAHQLIKQLKKDINEKFNIEKTVRE
jgi:hypothetical protein